MCDTVLCYNEAQTPEAISFGKVIFYIKRTTNNRIWCDFKIYFLLIRLRKALFLKLRMDRINGRTVAPIMASGAPNPNGIISPNMPDTQIPPHNIVEVVKMEEEVIPMPTPTSERDITGHLGGVPNQETK